MDYRSFLASKRPVALATGIDVEPERISERLKPWQSDLVRWALRQGRAALFEECGLGKTLQQLEWARHVFLYTGKPVLILTPPAVAPQTVREGEKFGITVHAVADQAEIEGGGIYVTNYQKLHRFDPKAFAGVVLDESSILKSFTGVTKRRLIEAFADTRYKLCCTATPAPNDTKELGNHAEFLGVMTSSEMLSRWFIADQDKSNNYRLKAHARDDYWRWVTTWAACVSQPSDLGYPNDGYDLPPLNLIEHVVPVDVTEGAEGALFRMDSLSSTTMHAEMRRTATARSAKVAELVNDSTENWVVWCNTDYEADELRRLIPLAVEVRGSHTDAVKEERLNGFTKGVFRVLVTKPSVAGFGLNWQHCHNVAFVGLSYSFEQLYQAVRRTWRFGQEHSVHCHLVTAETEGEVLAAVKRKMGEFEAMRKEMVQAMRVNQLNDTARLTTRQVPHEVITEGDWTMHLGDCCEVTKKLPSESVDLTIFSPPFSSLYIYSDAEADLGNSTDDDEFFDHFGYLVPELFRVTVPGRLCVVHCKDLPRYANRDGTAGLKDFPGDIIRLFSQHGWSYHSRVTIWKCPVVERERTNNNGLLHKTLKRDSSQVRQGMADYLLVFRRSPSEGLLSAKPLAREDRVDEEGNVISKGGLQTYSGTSDPRQSHFHPSPFARRPSSDPALAVWQRYAEPVWWDVDQMEVLNKEIATEERDEKHICPLQLGLIARCVELWSDPGELILSPFAGIGSEGYQALLQGRKFVGIELKDAYYRRAIRNLRQAAEKCRNSRSLFDSVELEAA